MDEKRKISGVRTDLSPSEFSANMNKGKIKRSRRWSNFKNFCGNVGDVLSSLGIFPSLKTSSSHRGHRGGTYHGGVHHQSSSFKESYKVDPPPRRTHEDRVREEIAFEAYMKMVDGKGDHDCGHEH